MRDASPRLMVFGRIPEPGRTKTRLAPALGRQGAARLYRALLEDTLNVARQVEGAVVELWLEGRPGAGALRTAGDPTLAAGGETPRFGEEVLTAAGPALTVRRQPEADLGGRLQVAFAAAFGSGCERAIALGSDHPTLPAAYLADGFEALRRADVVLGPASDGGYYAIGIRRRAWPRGAGLFQDMPWSSPRLWERTRARAAAEGLRVAELAEWYDVDRPEDLARLRREAPPDSRTGRVLAGLFGAGESSGERPTPARERAARESR